MILNNYILNDLSREIDEMEEEFQLMYFASIIVDGTFNFFKIERKIFKVGKPHFDLKNMIKLIFYGYINKITSTVELAYNAKYNHLYNLISHGIEPSDRTIRDYCKYFQPIYQLIMSFILIVANRIGLTDFEHISIDGTIKSAYNSPSNIIKEKDIRLLIKYYMVEELLKDEIKKLRRTAQKFLEDKSKSDEEKVDILFYWRQLLDYSGQVSLALNDHDARLMKTKGNGQKYPKLRSKTVEAHNGTFKRIYNYNHIPIIGLKRVQNLMFTIVASYNLIRLFNLIK